MYIDYSTGASGCTRTINKMMMQVRCAWHNRWEPENMPKERSAE